MIYFLRMEGSDYYKIGYTSADSPESRMATLQTACPRKLILVAYSQGELLDEATLHAAYSDKRTNGGDEWFELTPDEASKIAEKMESKSNDENNQRPINGTSAFDVRPIRGRQQHETSTTGVDVPRRATAFDHSGDQSVLNALRRKY